MVNHLTTGSDRQKHLCSAATLHFSFIRLLKTRKLRFCFTALLLPDGWWVMTGTEASAYRKQGAAGSCRSWELHRLEERFWDFPAVLLHRPRRSGGPSRTSPSICEDEREEELARTLARTSVKWFQNLHFELISQKYVYLFKFFFQRSSVETANETDLL